MKDPFASFVPFSPNRLGRGSSAVGFGSFVYGRVLPVSVHFMADARICYLSNVCTRGYSALYKPFSLGVKLRIWDVRENLSPALEAEGCEVAMGVDKTLMIRYAHENCDM